MASKDPLPAVVEESSVVSNSQNGDAADETTSDAGVGSTSNSSRKRAPTLSDTDIELLDPHNPHHAERLLEVAKGLRDQVSLLTRHFRDLQSANHMLHSELEVYQRHTLPQLAETAARHANAPESGKLALSALQLAQARKKPFDFVAQECGDRVYRLGWMYKEGGVVKNWKKRLFVLYGNSIEYFEKATDTKPRGVINLGLCTLSPQQNRSGVSRPCMELMFGSGKRKWHFTASVLTDNQRWYAYINNRLHTLKYLRQCQAVKERPDSRLLEFLNYAPKGGQSLEQLKQGNSSAYSQQQEEWPPSRPLRLNNQAMSLSTIGTLASVLSDSDVCPAGGVSVLELAQAGLGPTQVGLLAEALANSNFNYEERQRLAAQQHVSSPHSKFAPKHEHGVSSIDFSRNTLCDQEDYSAVESLAKVLLVNTCLHTLLLSEAKLDDRALQLLADSIPKSHCPLQRLSLDGNSFGDKGCCALFDMLTKGFLAPSERKVQTEPSQSASASSAVSVEDVEPHRFPLLEVRLARNAIADDGAVAIAKFLNCPGVRVRHLDLSGNSIGAPGLAALADAVRRSTHLEFVDVSNNPSPDAGAGIEKGSALFEAGRAFAHAAQVNSTLRELRFFSHSLDKATLNTLRAIRRFGMSTSE